MKRIGLLSDTHSFLDPAILKYFKKHEGKDYNDKVGIEQVKTQYGLYLYGQITLIEQILNREI